MSAPLLEILGVPLADAAQRKVAYRMLNDIRRYVKAKRIDVAREVAGALREAMTGAPITISSCSFIGAKTQKKRKGKV